MADTGSERAVSHPLSMAGDPEDEFGHMDPPLHRLAHLDAMERNLEEEPEAPAEPPIQVGQYGLRAVPSPSKNCTAETLELFKRRRERIQAQESPPPDEREGLPAPLRQINRAPPSKESTPVLPIQIHRVPLSKESTPIPVHRASKEQTPGPQAPTVNAYPQTQPMINGYLQNVQVLPSTVGAYVPTAHASLGPYPQPAPLTAAYIQGVAPPGNLSTLCQQPWGYGVQHPEYPTSHGVPGYLVPPNVSAHPNGQPAALYAAPMAPTNVSAYAQSALPTVRPTTVQPTAVQSTTVQPTIVQSAQSESAPLIVSRPLPDKSQIATEAQHSSIHNAPPEAHSINDGSNSPKEEDMDLDPEDDDDNDEWDEDSKEVKELFEVKGSAGRPSKELMEMFDITVKKIFSEIDTLALKMGRNPAVIKRTILGRLRGPNSWTYYAKYFKANQQEELARLPPGFTYDLTSPQGHSQVRKECYQRFQKDKGAQYKEVLRIWAETEALSEADSTVAERGRLFRKRLAEGQRLISHSELEGFQGVFVLVGENIRHDRSLRALHASPAFYSFFENHFLGNADEFLDHLQSWAYAGVSKIIMNANTRARLEVLESKVGPITIQGSTGKKGVKLEPLLLDESTVGATEDDEVNLGQELRKCLTDAAKLAGLNLCTQGKKFPWLSLLTICADSGFKLINYPDSVEGPHVKPKGRKSKGIDNLPKAHKLALLSQLKDTVKPLSFVKTRPEDHLDDTVVALTFMSGSRVFESKPAKTTAKTKKGKGRSQKSVAFVEDSDNGLEPEAAFTDSASSGDEGDEGEAATPVARRSHPRQAKSAATDAMAQLSSDTKSNRETRDVIGLELDGKTSEAVEGPPTINGIKRPVTPTQQSASKKRRRESPASIVNSFPPTDLHLPAASTSYVPGPPANHISNAMMLNPSALLNPASTHPSASYTPSNPQPASETPAVNPYMAQNGAAGYIPQEDQVAAALRVLGLSAANLHQLGIGNAQQFVQQQFGGPAYSMVPNGVGPAYAPPLNVAGPSYTSSSNTTGPSGGAYNTSANFAAMHAAPGVSPPQQNGGYTYLHGQAMYPAGGSNNSGGVDSSMQQ